MASVNLGAQSGPDIIWTTNVQFPSSIAFSGDSQRLAVGSPNEYWYVWRIPGGTLAGAQYVHNVFITCVALTSNGTQIVIGDDDSTIMCWQVDGGALQWKDSGIENVIESLTFSHDDERIGTAVGGYGALGILAASSGIGEVLLDGNDDAIPSVNSARFSRDDQFLASCGAATTAKLWRLSDNTLLRTFTGHSNAVNSVEFSPDGEMLATASDDGTARLWNVSNTQSLRVINGAGGVAKFSADGSLLISFDLFNNGLFKIWRVSSGAFVGSYTNTGATCFDIASNGKYFAYGRDDGTVVLAWMPVVIDSVKHVNNQSVLSWQGGSGLYQVQARSDPIGRVWHNVGGPTTSTSATNSILPGNAFYRVQSLPNP